VPIRDLTAQKITDSLAIDNFLTTHYLDVTNTTSYNDQDVSLPLLDTSHTVNIKSLLNSTTYPKLLIEPVTVNNVTYYVYYIKLREGDMVKGTSPSRVDNVLAAYDGSFITTTTTTTDAVTTTTTANTRFEYTPFPSTYNDLSRTISGWSYIFPKFHSGSLVPSTTPSDPSPALYTNFGAGVIFIPSGLAYFNSAQTSNSNILIPSYSPLIFSFKLYNVIKSDQDGDGILSDDEDINNDGDFTNDDTDGDGYQNFLDADDDNDGYYTKAETKKPAGELGSSLYYPFNPILDDPSTPIDESEPKGVPDCSGDGTSVPRLRKYLDPTCH
jgi:hypothetical protein